jgi:hypothetical protein
MGAYIKEKFEGHQVLVSVKYRNLAPLYCDEEMRICCKVKKALDTGHMYDVWIEGPTGGAAVVGTVQTARVLSTKEMRRTPYRQEDYAARTGTTGLKGLTIKRVENVIGNADPNSRRAADLVGRKSRSNKLGATSDEAPQLNEARKAETPVRPVSRSPISPTLDPQPRNVRRARTEDLEGPLKGLLLHKSRCLQPYYQPTLSKFAIPPLPNCYHNVNEKSSSESIPNVSCDTPSELERRLYRRNRPARTNLTTMTSHARLVEALLIPKKRIMAKREKYIKHRLDGPEPRHVAVPVSALKLPNLTARPTPGVRRYKTQPYQSNPAATFARYSRYKRDGIRKIDQLRIVRHGRTLLRPRRQRGW